MPVPAKTKPKAPKRAADVVDKVYKQIRELAIDYRFRPGERVNEVELAQRFNVSRTPVRQALSRLAHEEFVSLVPNRGFYAREIAPADVKQIYEFRAMLECSAFVLACERAHEEDILRVEQAWQNETSSGDWAKIGVADEAFHIAIAELAENPYVISTLKDINAKMRFFRRIDIENPERRENTFVEHAAVIDCLRRRDTAGVNVLRKHIVLSSAHAVEVTKEGLARIFFDQGNDLRKGPPPQSE